MKIAGIYSFNGGSEFVKRKYESELSEVEQVIVSINARKFKTKRSREKTMPGRTLYSPRALNKVLRPDF